MAMSDLSFLKGNREFRTFHSDIRTLPDSRKISGYAALFNSRSEYMGFYEVFAPGAFDDAIINSDVRCLFNHDPNLVFGRTRAGTLSLSVDDVGLRYEVILPHTPYADALLVSIARGDVSQSSLAFVVEKESWSEIVENGAKVPFRTIEKVRELYDVSPVTYPAYSNTTVLNRSEQAISDAWQKIALRYICLLEKSLNHGFKCSSID